MIHLCQSYDSGLKCYHVFKVICVTRSLPVLEEVVSGCQEVTLDVDVAQVVDDLRRGVGLMGRVIARPWTCLE